MNPGTILDIVLLAVSALIIIKFTVEGFFSSVLDFCKGFLAIVISYLSRIALANLFVKLFMKRAMGALVWKSLEAYQNESSELLGFGLKELKENNNELFQKFLTKFGLDYDRFTADFDSFFNEGNQEAMGTLADNVGGALAMMLSTVLALFVGTIIAYIVLSIVVHFLKKLTKFEEIKKANRWLGFAFGIIVALLVLWGSTLVLQLLVQFVGPVLPNVFNEELTSSSMVYGVFKHIIPLEYIKNLIYA